MMTARELREHIDRAQRNAVTNSQILERCEWLMSQSPEIHCDMAALRARSKRSLARRRAQLDALKALLTADEAANSWKGEDRLVEVLV